MANKYLASNSQRPKTTLSILVNNGEHLLAKIIAGFGKFEDLLGESNQYKKER